MWADDWSEQEGDWCQWEDDWSEHGSDNEVDLHGGLKEQENDRLQGKDQLHYPDKEYQL